MLNKEVKFEMNYSVMCNCNYKYRPYSSFQYCLSWSLFVSLSLFSHSKQFDHMHGFPWNNAMPEWQTNYFHEWKAELSLSLELKEINPINLKLFEQWCVIWTFLYMRSFWTPISVNENIFEWTVENHFQIDRFNHFHRRSFRSFPRLLPIGL
jgi:hypothetical protein